VTTNDYPVFSTACRRCERLAAFLDRLHGEHPSHYNRPVPSFGAARPRLLVVGLAPGLHGANRSGRPFTGDHAGLLLYRVLYRYGFATRSESDSIDDGLELVDCRITNAVRCVPPENKPTAAEVKTCNGYLRGEIAALAEGGAVLALGGVAHKALLSAIDRATGNLKFAHGAIHPLPEGRVLFDSYHCSRYNTNTGRLTEAMFSMVFGAIRRHLDRVPAPVHRSTA